jgi:hypothetical protein
MNTKERKQALEAILARPCMYVGNTPHLFTSVWSYLHGLNHGLIHSHKTPKEGLFPEGFRSWAEAKLHWKHAAMNWEMGLQEKYAGDEQKTFEAYRELILEYLREHPET